MTRVQSTVALCLGFVALVLGLFFYSISRPPLLSAEEMRTRGVLLLPTPREIEAFDLNTHTGEAFTLADLEGRWSFLFFGFTSCPDVCPTSMSVLAQAERTLTTADPDGLPAFQAVLVSVDPERDDAETLAAYVRAFSDNLVGVRGAHEDLAGFAENLNVAFARVPLATADGGYDPNLYQVDHTANIVIVNPRGHYHGLIKYPHQAATIVATFQSLAANF